MRLKTDLIFLKTAIFVVKKPIYYKIVIEKSVAVWYNIISYNVIFVRSLSLIFGDSKMIKSMTGFGRSESTVDGITVNAELRSVNHKFLEINARVPRSFSFLEENVKSLLKEYISRGKIDVFINIDTGEMFSDNVAVNHNYVKSYLNAVDDLCKTYGVKNDVTASSLIGVSDIFSFEKQEIDEDFVWNTVKSVFETAIKNFVDMRIAEGEKLKADVKSRMDTILNKVRFIEEKSPEMAVNYRERLELKVRELLGDKTVDEQRLLTETAIFADKVAVDEETVRLRSHLSQLDGLLNSDEPIGRRCDFLVQEMNREANTIGSKAQDVEITRCVVDIKAEIEKIREQIQNIE